MSEIVCVLSLGTESFFFAIKKKYHFFLFVGQEKKKHKYLYQKHRPLYMYLLVCLFLIVPTCVFSQQVDDMITFIQGPRGVRENITLLQANETANMTVIVALSAPTNIGNRSVLLDNVGIEPYGEFFRSIRTTCPHLGRNITLSMNFNLTRPFETATVLVRKQPIHSLTVNGDWYNITTCSYGAAGAVVWFDILDTNAPVHVWLKTNNAVPVATYIEPQCNTTWFQSFTTLPPYNPLTGSFDGYPRMALVSGSDTRNWTFVPVSNVNARYYLHIINSPSDCINTGNSFDTAQASLSIRITQFDTPPNTETVVFGELQWTSSATRFSKLLTISVIIVIVNLLGFLQLY